MKIKALTYLFCTLLGPFLVSVHAQVAVEYAVENSAQAAVQKLGIEMMKGNFKYGHERMYPRWKRRLATRCGGIEKLDAELAAAAQQKINMRLAVTAYRADRPTSFFSVWKAKKIDPRTGKPMVDATGREMVVEHWLAIVPTVTRVKIPDMQRGGKMRVLEEDSYAVAIAEKGSRDWYFMTGMKPTINDLRSLFPSLPPTARELRLPASKVREIK
ncbi:MAG: hypothetical protein KJO21_00610 [Verrucomicrobiae bacterium]|nr:hypothetical protein [Verrucomicrobiae bacterium]NNJ42034.1 hypothetical protein [Akkermansiaceae bacterium]